MYLYILMFVLFSFFTHKQVYAVSHFTGSSKTMPLILMIFSLLNILLSIVSVVHFSVAESFLVAIVSVFAFFLSVSFFNRIIAKIVLNKLIKDGFNPKDEFFIYTYNAECDIASTVIAEIGILANIAIVVFYVFLFLL